MASEQNQHLLEIIGRLEKQSKDHLKFASETQIDRLETPSLGMTTALSGGWAMGRQVLVWGPKSAGKSTFLLQQIAIAQRKGLVCAYFDVEKTFDKSWAEKLGVSNEELLYSKTSTVNNVVNDARAMMAAGVDVICIDSLSTVMPGTFTDENGHIKDFEKTGAIGGLARSLSPALSQLNGANDNTLLMFVSQIRMAQKGSMYWGASPTGGKAVDHAMSQSVRLMVSEGKDALVKGEVFRGDRILEKPIGREVNWLIDKDKVGPGQGSSGEYMLYFDGDYIGVDNYGEMVKVAVDAGVIKKGGAWYSYNGDNIGQGSLKVASRLREDAELYSSVKAALNGAA
jgi:recombination protein RecA